jgi:hypothetical protein
MKASNLFTHLLAAALVTIIFLLVYTDVQQSYRMQANDPQIQMAEDISGRLASGTPLTSILKPDSIDLGQSSSLFVEIYDAQGKLVSSTASLHGHFPEMPAGVLESARKNREDRITWEPRHGIRLASIICYSENPLASFVVVGRSLKETEVRIANIGDLTLICWLLCIALILIHFPISAFLRARYK